MQHHAAFHQGLHCLLRLKQPSGTEIHHNLENSTLDPLKYTMDSPILIASICMGNIHSEYKGICWTYVLPLQGKFATLNSIMGDMSVTVGGSKCTITSLTEDTLVCEPPQTPQLVDSGGYASVMVSWDKNVPE